MADLGEVTVKVESEGAGEAADDVKEGLGGDDGDGGLMSSLGGGGGAAAGGAAGGGIMSGILSALTSLSAIVLSVLAVLGGIVGILLSLEPIQKMISAIFKVLQVFFMPLARLLMTLLAPVLQAMIKLLPKWRAFLKDPMGQLKKWLETFDWGDALSLALGGPVGLVVWQWIETPVKQLWGDFINWVQKDFWTALVKWSKKLFWTAFVPWHQKSLWGDIIEWGVKSIWDFLSSGTPSSTQMNKNQGFRSPTSGSRTYVPENLQPEVNIQQEFKWGHKQYLERKETDPDSP